MPRQVESSTDTALAYERVRKGVSLRDLAEAAGVAPSTLYQIESGKTTVGTETAGRIAEALGVLPGELFDAEPRRWRVVS